MCSPVISWRSKFLVLLILFTCNCGYAQQTQARKKSKRIVRIDSLRKRMIVMADSIAKKRDSLDAATAAMADSVGTLSTSDHGEKNEKAQKKFPVGWMGASAFLLVLFLVIMGREKKR